MLSQITSLRSEMGAMRNQQNLVMSCLATILNPEQVKQLQQLQSIGVGRQLGDVGGQINHLSDYNNVQFDGIHGHSQSFGDQGLSGAQTSNLDNSGNNHGFFTQLLTGGISGQGQVVNSPEGHRETRPIAQQKEPDQLEKELEQEPYRVSWPDQLQSPQNMHSSVDWPETYDPLSLSDLPDLPEGMHDCCLAIEDNKKIKIVAIGQVYIPGEKIVVKNHFFDVSSENRRVSITDDVDPTALLPCPVSGFLFVCEAKDTFVPWPTNLIFPKKKYFPRVPATYSQEMVDEIRDNLVTYVLKHMQVNNQEVGENECMDVDQE
ncbi:uncharacterized protein [Spinacia oleracea]|uniref:DUF8039 domain-containing protein n=1 Tax=Spinacia oleracea TaxID=3562 RepID=A0ABM3R5W6_SPIOL|nr:uncharacterized protein LOC130466263 [Spinacia oleracea]XP_056691003.1 uncharacterized protein LOC130466263 [Spinacia oleracea]